MKKLFVLFSAACFCIPVFAQEKRPLQPSDVNRFQDIGGARVSPDGGWVAYVLTTVDSAKDKRDDNVWMISWDGKENIQLTFSDADENSPQWSPDGKWLSFISSRKATEDDKNEEDQLWLLNRKGGEAKRISEVEGSIESYAWRPGAQQILLVMKDADYSDTASTEIRKPYVMNRYLFKKDYVGYVEDRHTHLYLLDINSGAIDTLTSGMFDETDATWSPDGTHIAFVSNHTADPDKNENSGIYTMPVGNASAMQLLTTWPGSEHAPEYSPDGKNILYLQSSSRDSFTMYGNDILSVIPAGGGTPKLLSEKTDRPVTAAHWSKDGSYIGALMEDDRESNVYAFDPSTGERKKVTNGMRATFDLTANPAKDGWVALMSEPHLPFELFTVQQNNVTRLTYVQDSFLAPLLLPTVEGFQSVSKDGNKVSGILYKPANAVPGQKLPFVLYIHGGPVAQDDYEFDIIPQIIASAGYAVAQVNYRGSSGRGVNYITTIYGDWGDKEITDLEGAVDYLIKQGTIDENRMGVGGWSYGGISTDYMIATDQRFKAACSGAGSALQLSMYGTDQYVVQYNTELGPPWKNKDKWLKVSYAFFNADKIKTPTLFMASQNDFNVPVAGAEQMYQALRTNGIPTRLVIYPKQNHGLNIPSYEVDKYSRYVDWYNTYLK